jgi:hypothetical protein
LFWEDAHPPYVGITQIKCSAMLGYKQIVK